MSHAHELPPDSFHAEAETLHSGTWRVVRDTQLDGIFLVIEGLRPVAVGGRHVDPGTYHVRVDEARERIVLENEERTYALTAFVQRARSDERGAHLEHASRDGRRLLVVRPSRMTEWIA